MKRRLVLGLLVALCVLPAAGCGGGGSAAGEGAAGIVPAGVPVYVSINTDFEGDQITQARELLERFPGWSGALGMIEAELETDGELAFETDIRPALGPTLDIVLFAAPAPGVPESGGEAPVAVLLQPEDPSKLEALLARASDAATPVTGEVEGWTVIADDQATIDHLRESREAEEETLGESDAFANAMDGLEEDALVRAYLDLPTLTRAAASMAQAPGQFEELFRVAPLGAAMTAEENGFGFEATTTTEQQAGSFSPELPAQIPGGALMYVGLGDLASTIREALNTAGEQNPGLDQQIAQLELGLGVSLDEDVLPLVEQETAVALYPGAPGSKLPSVLVAMRVDDADAAVATVDRILARAAEFTGEVPEPRQSQVDGVDVREVSLPDGTTILYGGLDGKLFVTNDREVVSALAGDGPKLADDEAYDRARENAGVPDEVQSLLYVDLTAGADYALELAEQSGEPVPGPVRDNVEPLDALLLYGTQDGDRVRASGFLGLDE